MKRTNVTERRIAFVLIFIQTFSLRKTLEIVSKKFNVSIGALRVDWNRRDTWPKEVFGSIGGVALRDLYLLAIHRTLRQVDREFARSKNPSCRVGLLRTKAQILFKLIEFQQSFHEQDLVKRIESLEKRLESLSSAKEKREVS